MINVIKKQDPFSLSFIMEPATNKLKYIGFGVFPSRNLEPVRNVLATLLKTGSIACMDPENPCSR